MEIVAVRVVEPGEGGGAPRSFAMYTSSRPSRLRLDCWNMRVSMSRYPCTLRAANRPLGTGAAGPLLATSWPSAGW